MDIDEHALARWRNVDVFSLLKDGRNPLSFEPFYEPLNRNPNLTCIKVARHEWSCCRDMLQRHVAATKTCVVTCPCYISPQCVTQVFCHCNMSLQHDSLCLATLSVGYVTQHEYLLFLMTNTVKLVT